MKIGSLETEVQSLKVQIQVHDSENSRLRTQNTTQTMEMERNKKDYAMKVGCLETFLYWAFYCFLFSLGLALYVSSKNLNYS